MKLATEINISSGLSSVKGNTAGIAHTTALAYVAKGLKIFPCCWPIFVNEVPQCNCGQGHTGRDIGKAPIGKLCPNGKDNFTQTSLGVKAYWSGIYINANIAMLTDDYPTLDIDKDKGGYESLVKYESQYGKLPDTRTHATGGGGEHRIFRNPLGQKVPTAKFPDFPGLEIKAVGGYIIMPPSLHRSGNRYTVKLNIPSVEFPATLLQLIKDQKPKAAMIGTTEGEPIPQGQQDNWLFSRARGYRARGDTEELIFQKLKIDLVRCPQNAAEPYTDRDLARIAHSAARYSVNPGKEANPNDWMKTSGNL